MSRTVAAREANTRFGALSDYVAESNDPVIVETYGRPKVAIVSISDFEELGRLRDEQRRRDAIATLRSLREQVQPLVADLSEEEREELAIRAGRELMADIVNESGLRFARDERRDEPRDEHAGQA